MSFVEAIAVKRDGGVLDQEQIADFVRGATDNSLSREQLASMLMAICCRGMGADETRWLTDEMLRSGEAWDLAADRPEVVDKHSTGGVGDTVSLILAPLLSAVGVPVAMMAGRGLGHSQGTLDKLDAIPGLDSQPRPQSDARACRCVRRSDHRPDRRCRTGRSHPLRSARRDRHGAFAAPDRGLDHVQEARPRGRLADPRCEVGIRGVSQDHRGRSRAGGCPAPGGAWTAASVARPSSPI